MLCDQAWLDPDLDHTNGISMRGEGDMLRMDAVITSVQLNIRCLLEVMQSPNTALQWSRKRSSAPPPMDGSATQPFRGSRGLDRRRW